MIVRSCIFNRICARSHRIPGIVITDLDGYAQEELSDDDGSGLTVTELDSPGVSIPHILLERLRSGGTVLPCDHSRALVLFRPLSFTTETTSPQTEEKVSAPQQQTVEESRDDAMDLDDV